MKNSLIVLFVAVLSFFGKGDVFSVEMVSQTEKLYKIAPEELKWISDPALPKEIQASVVYGDPSKDGPLVLRLRIPAGAKIAPHWHPIDENVTVLSGSVNLGNGDKMDMTKGVKLTAGGFASIPKEHHHFAWVTEDTLLQLNIFGLWKIIYVNPKDDPRNK